MSYTTGLPCDTGAAANHTSLLLGPLDHAIGRSRGGLSESPTQLVDGRHMPLGALVEAPHALDPPVFPAPLAHLCVQRGPDSTPDDPPDRAFYSSGRLQNVPSRSNRSLAAI